MSNAKIYVMKDNSGLIKIGRAEHPKYRLLHIKTGNPTVELIYSSVTISNAAAVEGYCHKHLKSKRYIGEWFDCGLDEAVKVIESYIESIGKPEKVSDKKRIDSDAIDRIASSINAGLKSSALANRAKIGHFRLASVIRPESYRGSTKFTEEEVGRINKALDDIMNAMK